MKREIFEDLEEDSVRVSSLEAENRRQIEEREAKRKLEEAAARERKLQQEAEELQRQQEAEEDAQLALCGPTAVVPADAAAAVIHGPQVPYTQLPGQLDKQLLELDEEAGLLKSAILSLGPNWQKKATASVLAAPTSAMLGKDELKDCKNQAFDLLDALSRSGELCFDETEFHVILPVTHCFYSTLIDTIIRDNRNPIEAAERSLLTVGALVHRRAPADLIYGKHVHRLQELSAKVMALPGPAAPQES